MAAVMRSPKLRALVNRLQEGRVGSVQEEVFDLFSQHIPAQNLGFVDPKAAVLELSIAGVDLTVHQSPSVLASNRAGGTTGAVLWKVTPAFAEWLASPDNVFFAGGFLSGRSAVIELGCGISAVIGLLLAPGISRYVLTDQPYVTRWVEQNLEENKHLVRTAPGRKSSSGGGGGSRRSRAHGTERKSRVSPDTQPSSFSSACRLGFVPLDWETDEIGPTLGGAVPERSFDAVVACDCVYNEALVEPLVQACADACALREGSLQDSDDDGGESSEPCVCVIAQQLRDPDVFESWLVRFSESFDVWRVPDSCLSEGLRSGTGFVVHVGVLKSVGITKSDVGAI